jgi:hypothetical protein
MDTHAVGHGNPEHDRPDFSKIFFSSVANNGREIFSVASGIGKESFGNRKFL